jgi:zinc-binding alcohol dehydrogenase/oxidoreductase
MHAWILEQSPGSYRWGEIHDPEPGPGDIRVRVTASALNHMDLWLTRGRPRPQLPHVPGCDVAGVVDAVGEEVAGGLQEGAEVVVNPAVSCRRCRACLAGSSPLCPQFAILGEHRWGGHGEFVVVPAANVTPKPANCSWEEAAALGLATLTAWRMLRRGRLVAGETVLVVGVGGGVSSAAMVLAKAAGARVVATSRDDAKLRWAEAHGADATLRSDADWPVRADIVIETVGPATWDKSVRALAPGGRLVVSGGTSGQTVELNLPRLFFKQHEIIGSTMGSYEEWAEVMTMVEQGLPVVVDEVFDLADYPKALERLESGAQLGKIALRH